MAQVLGEISIPPSKALAALSTGGEWEAFHIGDDSMEELKKQAFGDAGLVVAVETGEKQWLVIALMCVKDGIVEPEDVANAYKMAASDRLLGATKGLLEKLQNVAVAHNDRSCEYDACDAVRKATMAIAKAEGR